MSEGDGIRKLAVKELKWDESIYPRKEIDPDLVESYTEVLRNGGGFPPIIVEEGTNRILDGVHRWRAHKKAERAEIPGRLVAIPEGETPKYYSARLNAQHGERMSSSEVQAVAVEIATAYPDADAAGMETKIAKDFAVPRSTVSRWVGRIYQAKRFARDMVVWKLSLLGWTQEAIGERMSIAGPTVRDILAEIPTWEKALKSLLGRMDVAEAAKKQDLPELLAWAVALDGKSDVKRMDELEWSVRPYDVWNFPDADDRFGLQDHPGRIPAQLIAHALFFYTEPGQLVLDPMAGGGTTVDVSLALGRRCLAYDVAPREGRPDIMPWDITKGLPPKPKGRSADLIFMDPPYFRKKDYGETSFANLSAKEYLGVFRRIAKDAEDWLTKTGRVALLMSDFIPSFDGKEADAIWLWDYIEQFEAEGFIVERRVQCPLSSQQLSPMRQTIFPEKKLMGRLGRDLVVFGR